MKEIFLMKLGEVVLKGANKRQFETKLRQNVRRRMKPYGNFDVYIMQSTVYVEPMDEEADVEGAWEACHSIFGVVSLCRCRPCEKDLEAIFNAVEAYLGDDLDCAKSFKVESKRSDKAFPLTLPIFTRARWRRQNFFARKSPVAPRTLLGKLH